MAEFWIMSRVFLILYQRRHLTPVKRHESTRSCVCRCHDHQSDQTPWASPLATAEVCFFPPCTLSTQSSMISSASSASSPRLLLLLQGSDEVHWVHGRGGWRTQTQHLANKAGGCANAANYRSADALHCVAFSQSSHPICSLRVSKAKWPVVEASRSGVSTEECFERSVNC